jgi:hypothetical protein
MKRPLLATSALSLLCFAVLAHAAGDAAALSDADMANLTAYCASLK